MALKRSLKNKKILITCGPTWIPIDSMRVISNQSTGSLGQTLAEDFKKAGAKVTLLEGPVTNPLHSKTIRILKFTFYNEFAQLFKKELTKKYHICVHAAAVSDYKIQKPGKTKLSSHLKKLKLELTPTQKIITQIKRINPKILLVGFKLESKISVTFAKKKSESLFEKSQCDLVVANSTNGTKYSGFILDNNQTVVAHKKSRKQLSKSLVNIMRKTL